jgi:hypothetical protein
VSVASVVVVVVDVSAVVASVAVPSVVVVVVESVVVIASESVPAVDVSVSVPAVDVAVEVLVVWEVWVLLVVDAESSVVELSSPAQPARENIRAEAMATERRNIFKQLLAGVSRPNVVHARSRATCSTYDMGARDSNDRRMGKILTGRR